MPPVPATPSLRTALGLLALLAAPARADLTLFQGAAGGSGTVVVVDESTGAVAPVPGLGGIVLVPIDAVGRTTLDSLLPGRPRLRPVAPGASRIELPHRAGSVYRFRRAEPGGGATYGLFVVGPDGRARVVLEVPGTGPAADGDPLLARVAVDPSGAALLVATRPTAGGNLIEVDLVQGTSVDRTPHLPPLEVLPSGLGLRAAFGVGLSTSGLVRFVRVPGATAQALPLPGSPSWFGGEVVFSDNGLVAATIAGASPTQAHPFAFGPVGPVVRLDPTPRHLSPAGFLPDSVDGPYLALSADGTLCVWCSEGVARDAWCASVSLTPGPAQTVTADAQFVDTLDEVGLAGSFALLSPRGVVLAVGERADDVVGGVEGIDFYLVEVPTAAGAPTITNLTLTSGTATSPFVAGGIDPTQGTFRLPGGARLLVRDDAGSGGRLSVVDLAAGSVTPVVPGAEALFAVERVDDLVLAAVERDLGGAVSHDLVVVDTTTLVPTTLASLGPTVTYDRFAVRDDGWVGLGLTDGALEWAARVHLASGAGELLVPFPFELGPTTAWTPSGRLALTGGLAGSPPVVVGWGLGTASTLFAAPTAAAFVLP